MKNLLEIRTLSAADITGFVELTSKIKDGSYKFDDGRLRDKLAVTMFFEPSTRTKLSFQLAARRLGMQTIDVNKGASSTEKGESLRDTIKTIESLKASIVIIRDSRSGVPQYIARKTNMKVVNAGDGMNEHPTQALLDIFTIHQIFRRYTGLTVVIVGDILHSRVAHSNIYMHSKLGNRLILCGPPTLVPERYSELFPQITISHSLDEHLPNADVVMLLRVQTERQTELHFPSFREFAMLYSMTKARMEMLKPDAIVMHPGPVNRDVEITAPALEDEHSVILAQVENGFYVRTAVLSHLLQ